METLRQLLDDELMDQALASVHEVAEGLWSVAGDVRSPWLADGHAGISLFYGAYSAIGGGLRAAERAEDLLEAAIEALSEQSLTLGLFSGVVGVAWVDQYLARVLRRKPFPGLGEQIDEALEEVLWVFPWETQYDLLHGLVGIGRYALDHRDARFSDRVLGEVVTRLDDLTVRCPEGFVWWTNPEWLIPRIRSQRDPKGYADTGMAHGIAGVIAVLARTCQRAGSRGRAFELLDGAVRWLLAHERRELAGSTFPAMVDSEGIGGSCRSAWCYGDPGIASSLIDAGQACGIKSWVAAGTAVARRDCRRPESDTGVATPGFCHGAAGIGHLYHRLYRATGEAEFADAAGRWFRRTLEMRDPDRGIAGYGEWLTEERRWHAAPGLLTGAAGVGLALLAASWKGEPGWDGLFMLDPV